MSAGKVIYSPNGIHSLAVLLGFSSEEKPTPFADDGEQVLSDALYVELDTRRTWVWHRARWHLFSAPAPTAEEIADAVRDVLADDLHEIRDALRALTAARVGGAA
jgi:hypothetical protein